MNIQRILIVDDEVEFCRAIQRHLRRKGFETEIAHDGVTAYKMIQDSDYEKSKIDIVIMELVIPKMNGLELAKKIDIKYPEIPVIFISGYHNLSYVVNIFRFNKDYFIKKPFTPETINKIIENIRIRQTKETA